MLLHIEESLLEYLDKYGFLFENDTSIIKEELGLAKKIQLIKDKYKKKRDDLLKRKKESTEKIKKIAKEVGEKASTNVVDDISERIDKEREKIRSVYLARKSLLDKQELNNISKLKKTTKGSLYVSGLSLASIIIYLSYKIHKDNQKKYKKICRFKIDKEACIKKYKIDSLKKRLTFLNSSITKCNFSKNPVKCRSAIDMEMLKLKEKIRTSAGNYALAYMKKEGDNYMSLLLNKYLKFLNDNLKVTNEENIDDIEQDIDDEELEGIDENVLKGMEVTKKIASNAELQRKAINIARATGQDVKKVLMRLSRSKDAMI